MSHFERKKGNVRGAVRQPVKTINDMVLFVGA